MTAHKTFVALTDRDDNVRWLQRALREDGEVLMADALQRAVQIIDVMGAALVFVDVYRSALERQIALIEGLLSAKPMISVVAMGPDYDPGVMRAVMRAGARDYLVPGGETDDVRALVTQLTSRAPRMEPRANAGHVVALANARPDTNSVMLGLHLALALQEEKAEDTGDTLLLDLGHPRGEALVYLGLEASYSFVDAVRSLRRLDETLIGSAFAQHPSGMKILSMPEDAGALNDITATDLYVLMSTLRGFFPNIVLNLGGIPDSDFLYVLLGQADRSLLVVEQSVPSCQQNMALLKRVAAKKIDTGNMGLVVDRYFGKLPPDADSLAQGLGLSLKATLPPCGMARLNVMNSGMSMYEVAPREAYCARVRRLARELSGAAAPRPARRHALAALAGLLGMGGAKA